nr:MAG TPA: Meiotic chromosome segregation protein [Caudoviricetes sp.]
MSSEEMKQCTKCGEFKPLDLFERRHGGKPGSRCKACVAEYKRAVYRKNKIAVQFESRVNTLKSFCKKNGIKINIEVLNDEVEWAKTTS